MLQVPTDENACAKAIVSDMAKRVSHSIPIVDSYIMNKILSFV